jgi:hypothetical protein
MIIIITIIIIIIITICTTTTTNNNNNSGSNCALLPPSSSLKTNPVVEFSPEPKLKTSNVWRVQLLPEIVRCIYRHLEPNPLPRFQIRFYCLFADRSEGVRWCVFETCCFKYQTPNVPQRTLFSCFKSRVNWPVAKLSIAPPTQSRGIVIGKLWLDKQIAMMADKAGLKSYIM